MSGTALTWRMHYIHKKTLLTHGMNGGELPGRPRRSAADPSPAAAWLQEPKVHYPADRYRSPQGFLGRYQLLVVRGNLNRAGACDVHRRG